MSKISAIVLTKNEEKNIKKCINSIKFCDEIVLVDDYSTDKTLAIARRLKVKIYKRKLNKDFASQRNFGLSKAKYEWVFFIDADEIVPKKLASEIKNKIRNSKYNGFYIKRVDNWLNKELKGGENGKVWLLRLARKGKGKWKRSVHETWKIRGDAGKMNNKLIHNSHKNVSEFVRHINFHATIHASENRREGKGSNFLIIFFYPIFKFLSNFVVKRGYVDGEHGFVAATIMSFHSFLSWSEQYYEENRTK